MSSPLFPPLVLLFSLFALSCAAPPESSAASVSLSEAGEEFLSALRQRVLGEVNAEPRWSALKRLQQENEGREGGGYGWHMMFAAVAVIRALRRARFGDLSEGYEQVETRLEDAMAAHPIEEANVTVSVRTPHFYGDTLEGVKECGEALRCEFKGSQADGADAYWYSAKMNEVRLDESAPRQVAQCLEGEANYEALAKTRRNLRKARERGGERYPLHVNYRLDADVPAVYGFYNAEAVAAPLSPSPGERRAAALYMQSNCVPYRDEYVRELMEEYPVDAGGKCLRTMRTRHRRSQYWRNAELYAEYRYAVCFENSVSDFYVTERVYQALEAGAVPLYMGAPSAEMQLPPGAVVFASDFAGPAELAAHLRRVDADPALLASYHAWRRLPGGGPNMRRLADATARSSHECRLCRKLADRSGPHTASGGMLVDARRWYDGSPWNYTAALPAVARFCGLKDE